MAAPSAVQWREAADVLRSHAAKFDALAAEADQAEPRPICGVVCTCGPNLEPLACGFKVGHSGAHAWATLPTFTNRASGGADEENAGRAGDGWRGLTEDRP